MPRRVRNTLLFLLVFAGVAGGLWVYAELQPATERRTTHHVCRICGSYRVEHELLEDGALQETSTDLRPSAAFRDLLDDGHAHDWAFDFENTEVHDGSQGMYSHADGFPFRRGRRPNDFTLAYNKSPEFRTEVPERLHRADLARIVALETLEGDDPDAVRARELLRR